MMMFVLWHHDARVRIGAMVNLQVGRETVPLSLHGTQGQTIRLFRSNKHSDAFYENLQQTIEAGLIWEDEIINVRKDGFEYVEQQTIMQ